MYKSNPKQKLRIKRAITAFTIQLEPIFPDKKELKLAAIWTAGRYEHLVPADLIHVIGIRDRQARRDKLFYIELFGYKVRKEKDLEYIIDHMIHQRLKKRFGKTMYSVLYPKNTGTYIYSPCNIEIGFQGSKCTCGDMANCAYR